MAIDKSLQAGSTSMLLLGLLAEGDRYGYQMIEELENRSDHTFSLKAGTLYPLLHQMEEQGLLTSYEGAAEGARMRKYYRITPKGKGRLQEKKREWEQYTTAVNRVLKGGTVHAVHC